MNPKTRTCGVLCSVVGRVEGRRPARRRGGVTLLPLLCGAMLLAMTRPLPAGEPKPPEAVPTPPKHQTPSALDLADAGHVAGSPYGPGQEAWPGPQGRIANINWADIPLGLVTEYLRDQFKGALDIVVPKDAENVGGFRLKLKNVTAEEIFSAMNHLFAAEGTPLQWRLLQNGDRPTAVLRKLESSAVARQAAESSERRRVIVYVGDFTSSKWPIARIAEVMTEIVRTDGPVTASGSSPFEVKLHQPTDILVLSGSMPQIAFAEQALSALRQQAARDARRSAVSESVAVMGEVNKPGTFALPEGGRLSLVEAIANAGGFTKLAKKSFIQLSRKGEIKTFSFDDLLKLNQDPEKAVWLQPGDVVMVPQTTF